MVIGGGVDPEEMDLHHIHIRHPVSSRSEERRVHMSLLHMKDPIMY